MGTIKSKVSSAWEEIDTLKVPVSGAYQEADHANALVNGAWQEVWSSGYSFTPTINNTTYGTCTPQGSSVNWTATASVNYGLTIALTLEGDVDIPVNTAFDVSFALQYAKVESTSGAIGGGTIITCYDASGKSVSAKNITSPTSSTTVNFTGLKSTTNPIKKITITVNLIGSKFSFDATITNLVVAGTKCKFV